MRRTSPNEPDPFKINKCAYIEAAAAWLETKRDEWDLYAVTVTFKPVDQYCDETRWRKEYERVLFRIARRLTPNKALWATIIPQVDMIWYERDIGSKLKRHRFQIPNHIHSVLPIPKAYAQKFWDKNSSQINPSIARDVASMKTVINMDVQPIYEIDNGGVLGWITYGYKGGKEI